MVVRVKEITFYMVIGAVLGALLGSAFFLAGALDIMSVPAVALYLALAFGLLFGLIIGFTTCQAASGVVSGVLVALCVFVGAILTLSFAKAVP